jgi:cytidylate kinase
LKSKNKILRVTCDGGAATGKSTGAKLLAKKYKLAFLSSGLLYRYAAYLNLKYKPINKVNFLKKKFKILKYKNLEKINLHTPKISVETSRIAGILTIRNILKKYQRDFIKKNKKCVLEGRDASTKILPNSNIKFFFICNLNVAAKRRYNELNKRLKNISFIEVKRALYNRNLSDKNRSISPLQKHPDAVLVNTSKIGKQAMLAKMSKYVEKFLRKKYGN